MNVHLLAVDRAPVLARRFDSDGRMRVSMAPISRVGVSLYRGDEVPGHAELGLDPDRVYAMFRSARELAKAAATFKGVRLLREHIGLDEKHRPELVIGAVGTDCRFVYPYLLSSVTVWTADAIRKIESGERRQLSCGYAYSVPPRMEPGVFRGQSYDGVMVDLCGHHVALVDSGRAGPDCGL